jgi:hypothetical protein
MYVRSAGHTPRRKKRRRKYQDESDRREYEQRKRASGIGWGQAVLDKDLKFHRKKDEVPEMDFFRSHVQFHV